jgi:hypothetical protein
MQADTDNNTSTANYAGTSDNTSTTDNSIANYAAADNNRSTSYMQLFYSSSNELA